MSDGADAASPGANSAAIEASVVETVAADHGVDAGELATVITVVGADLTDAHHEFERATDYATVDQTRVYAAGADDWAAIVERNDAADLAAPLRAAHREQADRLVDSPPDEPLLVGVDTAEEADEIPQQYEE